jgi:hypothetical protein
MKQPREGITGIDRSGDDLLSLDMRAVAHRNALIAMARHLHTAVSVGNPAPVVERMGARMRSPQPGDFVVEPTMARRGDLDTRIKALGYLIEKREEWWETDAEWQATKVDDDSLNDDGRPTDEAWYIQYGPAQEDVCRWVNCAFVVVPISDDDFSKRAAGPDGWITRDTLLGALADSGFQLRTELSDARDAPVTHGSSDKERPPEPDGR